MEDEYELIDPALVTPEWLFKEARRARELLENQTKSLDIKYVAPMVRDGDCSHQHQYTDEKQGDTVCTDCGLVMTSFIFHVNEYNGETHWFKQKSVYKRIHHFNERINQWMCNDPPVPQELVDAITPELLANPPVNKTKIRHALHKHNGVKYIERWLQIYCRVTGHVVPTVSACHREAMKEMFILWEASFRAVRPETRKCIINYNLIFVRMLQLLNLPEHYKYFPMLKSKLKVKALDEIWKNMCRQLGLKYMPLPPMKSLR